MGGLFLEGGPWVCEAPCMEDAAATLGWCLCSGQQVTASPLLAPLFALVPVAHDLSQQGHLPASRAPTSGCCDSNYPDQPSDPVCLRHEMARVCANKAHADPWPPNTGGRDAGVLGAESVGAAEAEGTCESPRKTGQWATRVRRPPCRTCHWACHTGLPCGRRTSSRRPSTGAGQLPKGIVRLFCLFSAGPLTHFSSVH